MTLLFLFLIFSSCHIRKYVGCVMAVPAWCIDGELADKKKNLFAIFLGKKVLLTGGGGYFGHKLGNELKMQGAEVVLFDIFWPYDEMAYSHMKCIQVCVQNHCGEIHKQITVALILFPLKFYLFKNLNTIKDKWQANWNLFVVL